MRRVVRLDLSPNVVRYLARRQQRVDDQQAASTVDVDKLDRRDEVNIRYQKSFRRIKRAIDAAVADHAPDAAALIHSLTDADDHGLLGWCFRGNGMKERPLSELRQTHPAVWAKCEQAFRNL